MNLKPEILTHPHIPKPLHGLAPRSIMGDVWWNTIRKEVYASSAFHCVACGVHKSKAKKHQWLEAHEFWNINYETGLYEISSIEPLCHYCHNFIHSGGLSMIIGKEKYKSEIIEILEHGLKILSENKLQCFPFTLDFAKSLGCKTFGVKAYSINENHKLKWSDWKLVWEGKTYKSKFKNQQEHSNFYI